MCNFITAVLPPRSDDAAFRALAKTHRLRFEPLGNLHLLAQLKPGEGYFHATNAMCDCATGLVGEHRRADEDEPLRTLRQKGWSEAKIARWVASRAINEERARDGTRGELSHLEWVAFLGQVLRLRSVPYVGLLQHFYKSDTSDEAFELKARSARCVAELEQRSFVWEADVLYTFAAPS